jgi:spore photoproduct lyase
MYALQPAMLFAWEETLEDPESREVMRRLLRGIGRGEDEVEVAPRERVGDVAAEIAAWPAEDADGVPWQHRRALVFTPIAISDRAELETLAARDDGVDKNLKRNLLGLFPLIRNTHDPKDDEVRNLVCWNTQDFGVMNGCPHGCQYCPVGKWAKHTSIGTNLSAYMEQVVAPTIEQHPGQKCFRLLGWGADIATFEPEYGAFAAFLHKLSEYPDHYGYFHTAGDNVDWVHDVPHRDRLIGVWSMTCESAARLIEPGSPSAAARVEAARRCQAWGLPVRFKFKPMIPVRNWREEYASMIERIFERVRPESLGFCVLMWMTFEDLAKRIDLERLDPEFVTAARENAETLRNVRTGPFPHVLREEVYRFLIREVRKHDSRIPIYISTESREMWNELKDELGQNPCRFICGCNPIEAPGPRMLSSEQLSASTYR